ncbi:MAG: 4a-hydroxytetrahydrobiopterin dehydratase [Deltaproteobacteria bacterium]|nr:4a-hydroxytetrahydrobiopterin dehydratase [Deltaproteobacteria bacterium]
MATLAEQSCQPCRGGVPPLSADLARALTTELAGWTIIDGHLTKPYDFIDFAESLAFVDRVGELAEYEGHHPDIYLTWGRVRIELWTHKVNGLTTNDFIMAAKIDRMLQRSIRVPPSTVDQPGTTAHP